MLLATVPIVGVPLEAVLIIVFLAMAVSICVTIAVVYFFLVPWANRRQNSNGPAASPSAAPVSTASVPTASVSTTSRSRMAASPLVAPMRTAELPAPKRKLFFGYAAVVQALKSEAIQEEDLADCLFCVSDTELALGEESDSKWLEYLLPFFTKALQEGRLIKDSTEGRLNAITYAQVNGLLARHGAGPLFVAESVVATSYLDDIPMHACVPRVSDNSFEVLFCAQKLPRDWRRCFKSIPELEPLSDGELAARKDAIATPPDRSNWQADLNRDVTSHARRRHEPPKPPAASQGSSDDDGQEYIPDRDGEPDDEE